MLAISGAGGRTIISATIDGVLRGIIHPGLDIVTGEKIADIDPRAKPEHCMVVSDKARAVAGGVLEAIMYLKGRVKR